MAAWEQGIIVYICTISTQLKIHTNSNEHGDLGFQYGTKIIDHLTNQRSMERNPDIN